jgi:hypothetical protein
MVKSIISGLFHQFKAGRLRAELPVADENLIERIVQQNASTQDAPQRSRRRHPFRLGELANDWRLEVPHVGAF